MSQEVREKLKEENLCTHFILPLMKINKFSFVPSNFVNCYLNRSGTLVFVEVLDTLLVSRSALDLHYAFQGIRKRGETFVLVYRVTSAWTQDVQLFIKGKYSKMGKPAKDFIRKHSGLNYKKKEFGKARVTDARLLALEKHPMLKNMWENLVDVTITNESELLSIPGDESFMELEEFEEKTQSE